MAVYICERNNLKDYISMFVQYRMKPSDWEIEEFPSKYTRLTTVIITLLLSIFTLGSFLYTPSLSGDLFHAELIYHYLMILYFATAIVVAVTNHYSAKRGMRWLKSLQSGKMVFEDD